MSACAGCSQPLRETTSGLLSCETVGCPGNLGLPPASVVEQLRAALAAVDLDGPFEFPAGGLFSGADGPRSSFAVCLRCGAMVVLGDPEETTGGRQIERGVRLHTAWHERSEA